MTDGLPRGVEHRNAVGLVRDHGDGGEQRGETLHHLKVSYHASFGTDRADFRRYRGAMRAVRIAALACLVVSACAPSASATATATATPHEHATAAAEPDPSCRRAVVPIGALAPATPAWCERLGTAVETAVRAPDRWIDEFDGHVEHASLPPSYRVYASTRTRPTTIYRTETFAHNDHWMVDIGGSGSPPGVYVESALDFELGPNNGGALMRPDAAFHFVDGRLVVEFDVSTMTDYDDRIWPEIVVSTAPDPSRTETNGWYAAGLFGGYPAVGCSVPVDRLAECRVYDETRITANLSAQLTSGATTHFGGAPSTPALDAAWRTCGPEDPDAGCRDRFRILFEKDALTIFVNGVKYMEHRGLPPAAQLPAALLTSPVYVYFGSWAYLVEPGIARVHWDRIAINP